MLLPFFRVLCCISRITSLTHSLRSRYLEEKHAFKADSLDTLYEHGKLLYEIGMYAEAQPSLYVNFILSTDPARSRSTFCVYHLHVSMFPSRVEGVLALHGLGDGSSALDTAVRNAGSLTA
jgi:hypothetical protein